MARHGVVLLVSALALAGCNKPVEGGSPQQEYASQPVTAAASAPEAAADASARSTAAPRAAPAAKADAPIVTAPLLAYSYDYAIAAPPKAIRALAARHEAACQAAGPTVCQVIAARINEAGADQVAGTLSLRATPAWLATFRAGLGKEAEGAGGRVTRAATTTEDLSRAIVDTEAALRARAKLRDRLEILLASRPGKLSELLEVEQELARVQGEIDATQSELAMMRTRVTTSKIDIAYESSGVLAPEGVGAPIAAAVGDVAGALALTLAFMIRLATWLAPWALLVGVPLWLFRKRLFAKKPVPAPPPPPPA
jgi:hypothetical protein